MLEHLYRYLLAYPQSDTGLRILKLPAQSGTADSELSFSDTWMKARHCIISAVAIFEPDLCSSKAEPTRIISADEKPMGIAGFVGNMEKRVLPQFHGLF